MYSKEAVGKLIPSKLILDVQLRQTSDLTQSKYLDSYKAQ